MEKQDILDILDSLDMQISMGKIDQATYSGLREKWIQKLQALETGVSTTTSGVLPSSSGTLTGQISPPVPEAEVLSCPKCAGPAEIDSATQDLTKPIQCVYCGTTYTLRQSQDNSQQLKQELKAWLEKMVVGSGSGSSSTIDVNARRFIFDQNVYPSLKKEIDRQLETIEYAPEAPMVQMKLTVGFSDYQPNALLVSVGQGNNGWLKTLVTRVSAPQIQDFAVTPGDKLKLTMLQYRVQTLVYYANIAFHLAVPAVPAYQIVRQNLLALQKEYQSQVQDISDEAYRSYITALDSRITGALLLLDVLISVLEKGRGVVLEATKTQLTRAIAALAKAEQMALISTYNPLYTVPLQQGIQKDLMVAQIFRACVKCYEIASLNQSVEFPVFYDQLLDYARTITNIQSPNQLLGLLESISLMLSARAAVEPVRVLADWSWVDGVVESNRLKPTFGTPETVNAVLRHYHPYWVASLNYAEKSGIIFQKGTGREALIFVDATSIGMPLVGHMLVNDPNLPALQTGLTTFNLLDKQFMALPSLLSQDMAEKAMKVYASQHATELGTTIVKMVGMIYIPAAFARYVGKKGDRGITLSRLNTINQNLQAMLAQTNQFLGQYSL